VHAEVIFRGASVMLSTAGIGREPFRSLPAGGRLVYCALDQVDSLYERVGEADGDIALAISDTDYGSRDFTVRNPEGNPWAFGTYRPEGEDAERRQQQVVPFRGARRAEAGRPKSVRASAF
jgi:uncharacterized glyoxalase superfamily protein PhnB